MENDLRTKDSKPDSENVFVARVVQHVGTGEDVTKNGCVKIVTDIRHNTTRFHRYLIYGLEMVFTTLPMRHTLHAWVLNGSNQGFAVC